MKTITISFPTTFKELKDDIKNKLKWIAAPRRRTYNKTVILNLGKKICSEIKSGDWKYDISETMKADLTKGSPNWKINIFINEGFIEERPEFYGLEINDGEPQFGIPEMITGMSVYATKWFDSPQEAYVAEIDAIRYALQGARLISISK